jgi:hypothetical protein
MSANLITKQKSATKASAIQTRLHLDEAIQPEKQIPKAARAECVTLFMQLIEAVVASDKSQIGGRND